MNPSAVLRSERLRPLTRLAAAWGVWAALGLAIASPVRADSANGPMTPAGTVVTNEATVTYSTQNGEAVATASTVSFTVGQVAGVDIEPPRMSLAAPGSDVVLLHTLMNVGNGQDAFVVQASASMGSQIRIYEDVDRDGLLTPADTLITGPLSIDMGGATPLLVVVSVSLGMTAGDVESVQVQATSQFDGSVTDLVDDQIRSMDGTIDARIEKVADRTQASPGDLLTYSVRVRLDGDGQRDSVVFVDKLPEFSIYEAGTLSIDGVTLTDAQDGDAGSYQPATGILQVDVSSLASGTEAIILFQARVDPSTPIGGQVANRGRVVVHTPVGILEKETTPAVTQVAAPSLSITKSVTGFNPSTNGDSLVYTITVSNPSTSLAAVDLTVVDTLPAVLSLFRSEPAPTLSGRVATWTLPRLEPGADATFTVALRVPEVPDSVSVVNRAHVNWDGGTSELAESEARTLLPSIEAHLDLALEAEVVETRIGDVLPLRATVTNDGLATVADLLVKLVMPEGTRFIDQPLAAGYTGLRSSTTAVEARLAEAGPAEGADEHPMQLGAVQISGDTLYVVIPGELQPREAVSFRYLLMVNSAREGVLLNKAIARAYRGSLFAVSSLVVASNQAQAMVGLARNRALETRSIMGKVFHDIDGDGMQSPDEPGVAGVDIVTADGEMVTTDEFGKLSFNDLRPGRHAFRVDPLSLPQGLVARATGLGSGFQVLEINGWNTPRLSIALDALDANAEGATVVSGAGADSAMADDAAEVEVTGMDAVTVAPLRPQSDRDADQRSAFLHGPAIRVHAPADGTVVPGNRLYIGVQGEAMRPVALFLGDSLIVEGQLLPNGVGDFVGIEVAPGPQRFRVRMLNSWGTERWDSITVHASGSTRTLEREDDRVTLSADGRTLGTTRFRLLDAWGVPVTSRPFVTVDIEGGRVVGSDVDPTSVGQQLKADAQGWVTVDMVGGREPGEGTLQVEVGDAVAQLPLVMLPPIRPLFLTGVGQISLGSAGSDFGAITAQGRIADATALTLSYDTRRLDQGRDVFGRSFDPLDEGRSPILGDASVQRSLTPSRYRFAARVERGLDWVMFGDVQTSGFSDGMSLARYGRSLPGAAARLTTGAVVWNAFGASTSQTLQQQQIRGEGSSGPFELGTGVLPGTEELRIEVRALDNPTRLISEQRLTRYAEYQIDYERGTLLLKQPIPSADAFGNPVFLSLTYEGESGGDQNAVWGVRASSQLDGLAGNVLDSIPLSVSFVNDDQAGRGFRLGAVRTGIVQNGGLEISAEVAIAEAADSSGVATRIRGASPLLDGRVNVSAEWTHVGDEFTNPANIALRPGADELRSSATAEVHGAQVTLAHERQSFTTRDLARRRTTLGYRQNVAPDVVVDARLAGDASESAADSSSSGAGEYRVTWSATSRLDVFGEGRNELWSDGEGLANRGAYWGGGASFRLARNFGLEARHLRVSPTGGANPYALTSIGMTSDMRVGTRAWGSYQISGGIDGQTNAAVVGLNHRFSIGPDWRFSTMVERRNGVGGATLGDPVLVSPFDRPEENYTTASVGTEYIPQNRPYRLSFRAEKRDGNLSTSTLATLAGDVSLNAGLAMLSRQEYVERDAFGSLTTRYSRERSSLWGLAYRPMGRDDLNILFKFGWKDAVNPFGSGVLAADGEESRVIGAMEAVWAPRADVEFGARLATRTTSRDAEPVAGVSAVMRNHSEFLGLRGRWFANDVVGVEVEARALMTDLVAGSVWDVSPGLVVRPLPQIEIEVGHRFGDLQDPDFAVKSGSGWFLTLGTRLTEDAVASAAAFWRSRFGG